MTTIEDFRKEIIERIDKEIEERLDGVKDYSESNFVYHEIHNEIATLDTFKFIVYHVLLNNIENERLRRLISNG